MSTLIFRGAFIRHLDFRKDDGGYYVRVHFTADFSSPVAEAMEWGEPPDGCTSGKLSGQLVTQHIVFTPNTKELKQHEFQLDFNEVSHFEFVRVTENESTRTELRFQARTPVNGAEGILGAFCRRVGESASQLRVNYTKQEALPLDNAEEDSEEPEEANGAPAPRRRAREKADAERQEKLRKIDEEIERQHKGEIQ